jgi:hypothetical protein
MDNLPFQAKVLWRLYATCKNKQDPTYPTNCCFKIQTFFNGFHHYSPYIDYFSINCIPQLAKKGGGGD